MVNLRVVDIYHGDRVSNFKKATDFGIWGIIHKATTGATGKDAKYPARRKPASNAGLLWGAYHWGTKADVAKQVKNFLDYAEPYARCSRFPAHRSKHDDPRPSARVLESD
jgi:GH25 family lysozyme M1 (1,4-beta-N-acetylmuramidase)